MSIFIHVFILLWHPLHSSLSIFLLIENRKSVCLFWGNQQIFDPYHKVSAQGIPFLCSYSLLANTRVLQIWKTLAKNRILKIALWPEIAKLLSFFLFISFYLFLIKKVSLVPSIFW